MVELFPYQKVGARFLASRRRAMLLDDTGLGKTAQACHAAHIVGAASVLVVCPASLILNWEKEWKVFGPRNCVLTAVSYNFIRKISKVNKTYDVIIADESQALGKWTAKQTRVFVKLLAPKGRRIWLLSASPAVKSAADYHPQLSVMLPGELGLFKDFRERHCTKRVIGAGRYKREDWIGFKDTERINALLKRVSLRRMKDDVLHELPSKRFSNIYIEVPAPEIDEDEIDQAVAEGRPSDSIIPPLRQLGLDKAKEASEYLNTFREPIIIWCWFRDTVEYLADKALKGRVLGFMTGKESAAKKEFYKEKFQAGRIEFLIGNIAAGGVGHTLTAASTCIFLEFPFSPALYEQSWSRIYRIGTKRPVNIINVIAENSLDEKLLDILQRKSTGMKRCLA